MSNVMEWMRTLVDNVVTVPRLAIGIAIFFAATALVVMVLNSLGSIMARLRRADKAANKFYVKCGSIDYNNILIFKKKSVSKLPKCTRKLWNKFEASGVPLERSAFTATLREKAAKGGSVGFAVYLYIFIVLTLLMVVAMCFSNIASDMASMYICGSLIAGAIGLFLVGLHLYFMDKKTDARLDNYITNVLSRIVVFKSKNYAVSAAISDINTNKATILDNPQTVSAPIREPQAAEPIVVNSAWRASDFNKLEGLMAREVKLQEGYASMETLGGTAAYDDSVTRLDRLVTKLLANADVSPELIETIYDCINAVVESRYARPIDELRMRCVVRRLKNAI